MKVTKKYFGPCQSALEYFSRGNFKKLIEDYNGAVNDYTNAVRLRPVFWEAYYQRGDVFSVLMDHTKAEHDYNKAIELILKYY
jgi:tetratricopeptide (TPR) repeat protein